MSNPTSNFGWQMPTPTDLVTDLPADFEVFGQAVDSSLADLKGGTTGQVLSKNSNTDMDFVWVTDAAGDITGVTAGTGISGGGTSGTVTITNSMATEITAKGDLIVGTGSATFDNLAAGANGSTLVADSAATTGLRYSATPSASNPVINGAMQVWQRGTSFTNGNSTTLYFAADRWQIYAQTSTGRTWSRQATNDTTNLPNIQYCMRLARNSGDTQTTVIYTVNNFETINSIPFAGKTVTLSFYARAGANYSSTSNAFSVGLLSGTGTDQNSLPGYTGQVSVISSGATLTTTWQRFTFTGTVPTNATELGIQLGYTPTGTAGANDYAELTGVQIDIGSVALPFRTNGGTIQGELAACQRYLPAIMVGSGNRIYGYGTGATQSLYNATFPVTARVAPTGITAAAVANFTLLTSAGATGTPTSLVFDSAGVNSISLTVNNTAASPTIAANTVCQLAATASGAYILFTGCEL